ncbi:molecular chaperone GrpE [Promicromonospora umidemergens]|uniref:Protein GrpE n=1 Tax=Promicromonospora umidemergens TaxID=629679 RepID=A0ABP8WUL9_9MICO|nr:nucleotide exchange factor GrpE [Promicromonospora umidemergens]MCP2283699.1 molecular chaperone GrpE [Promicromonospora umidemergens]
MTEENPQGPPEPDGSGEHPFQFRDKRKVNNSGDQSRPTEHGASDEAAGEPTWSDEAASAGEPVEAEAHASGDPLEGLDFEPSGDAAETAAVLKAQAETAEHLDALQRERASFTNYRNRALRDQEAARNRGVQDVLAALLPVLDDVERAKQHGELGGAMAAIAEKLDQSLQKFGVERFGKVGEEFDPTLHEALMHSTDADATAATVNLVVEPGYKIGDKVVRAARVGVVGPE